MIPVLGVPTLTKVDLLEQLIISIDYPVETLFIVDNGGRLRGPLTSVRVQQWSDHVKRVFVAQMPANLGVASSWNLIVKANPFAPYWMIASDDVTLRPGALEALHEAASEKHLALCSQSFVMFALGSRVVERVGLFDERFHPAYWEDIDYNWRCHEAGIDVVHTGIEIDHVGCATRNSLMDHRDEKFRDVFARNRTLHLHKQEIGELGDGHWSLSRRRQQTWD